MCYDGDMGSGRGKTRRAKTGIFPSSTTKSGFPTATYEPAKLEEFLRRSAVADVNTYEYYLGPERAYAPVNERQRPDVDHEKVLAEVFADAVEVGAIVLPDSYATEDFSFRMVDDVNDNVYDRQFDVVLKDRPEHEAPLSKMLDSINPLVSMRSGGVDITVERMVQGINSILSDGRSEYDEFMRSDMMG